MGKIRIKSEKMLLCFFLLLGSRLAAQSSVWKISRNGNSLYLGGSVHVLRAEDYPLPGEFETAFNRAAILFLEADIEQLANPEVAAKISEELLLPGHETLETVLDKKIFKQLRNRCLEYGIPIDTLLKYKPSVVVNLLGSLETGRLGFEQAGPDLYYLSQAKQYGKKLDFLESIDTQIALLTDMGTDFADEYIRYALADWEKSEAMLEIFIQEWKSGSGEKLSAELADMKAEFPLVYKAMFTDRNNSWMPALENCLATGAVEFIIAGLGHFYGPDGLLEQLKNRGCRIEQILAD